MLIANTAFLIVHTGVRRKPAAAPPHDANCIGVRGWRRAGRTWSMKAVFTYSIDRIQLQRKSKY